ncbi:MAG: HAMP domain-containing protein [Elusimicrobia bacterium]|nr:HAMP domain-containing protein [Elusimicrobiota bacterium]
MASESVRRGRLAYKFLFWFLTISIAPIAVVGWQLVAISQNVLKEESLRNQQSQAVGFAETVYSYISTFKNVLAVASKLEGFSTMDPVQQQRHLNRVMQQHAAFLELSVFDLNGKETLRMGRFLGPAPEMRSFAEKASFQTALQAGEYLGSLERFQDLYPTLTIAVSILDPTQAALSPRKGVLLGLISLNGLSQMLHQQFPEKSRTVASVVAVDGFLVADSNPEEVYRKNAKIPKEVLDVITTQVSDKGGGKIDLKDGATVLGSFATVKDLGWVVYIQQPVETAYLAAHEMRRQIYRVICWVIGVTALLAWAVASHITQPVRALKQAADRLKAGQFEDLPEMMTTNDEIGDLAQSFVQMSESLKDKTGELVHAKEELEKFTKFLEKRVEARTRELKAAQDELIKKERLAAIGSMASVVGHEIRNPLAVINNSTFFIKTKLGKAGQVDPKVEKHIAIIESEIKQANGIISEILTYSRSREMKCEVLSLNRFLEDLVSVYPFPPHIEAVKSFDPRDATVNIDQDEMRQAVRNLIGNGIEVMPNGGRVKLTTEVVDAGWVRIDVGDNGSGIPPDILEKIFAPFFTTKARGTGLGLAVVRKVIDRHQGRVDVESAVGKGTTFKIYLPLASNVPAPGAGPLSAAAPKPPEPSQYSPSQDPAAEGRVIPQTQIRPTL